LVVLRDVLRNAVDLPVVLIDERLNGLNVPGARTGNQRYIGVLLVLSYLLDGSHAGWLRNIRCLSSEGRRSASEVLV